MVVRRIQQWTRDVLGLSEDVKVMVHEIRCEDPGCPPHGTVIGIFRDGHPTRSFHVPLPASAVLRPRLEKALQKAIESGK
jgi:hypothetical protein